MGAWLVVPLSMLTVSFLLAQDSTILLDRIELVGRMQELSPTKVEAGLALACALSHRYRLVTVRDSALSTSITEGLTRDEDATRLEVQWKLALRLDRFHNLLRADLSLWNDNIERRGTGYALVRHRRLVDEEAVVDPALLAALQRALCVAVGDTLLYAELDSAVAVRPASVLAVTSMELIDDPSLLPQWELFEDKIGTSYSGVLSAIVVAQQSPYFVAIDIDTRDSMYAQFRLYEPEEGIPPSWEDIAALHFFGVDALISGSLQRTIDGAVLTMHLYHIAGNSSIRLVRTVSSTLDEDSRISFLQRVFEAVREILSQPLPLPPGAEH